MAVGLAAGMPVFLWRAGVWDADTVALSPQTLVVAAGIGAVLLATVGVAVLVAGRAAGYWGRGIAEEVAVDSGGEDGGAAPLSVAVETAGSVGARCASASEADGTGDDLKDDPGAAAEPSGGAAGPSNGLQSAEDGTADGPLRRDPAQDARDRDEEHPKVTAGSIIAAWDAYRRDGDGFFTAAGFTRTLRDRGVEADVHDGSRVGASGKVLVVESAGAEGRFAVVPSFMTSPRAAPQWFNDESSGSLSARTERINRLAEGKWTDSGFQVVAKGDISD